MYNFDVLKTSFLTHDVFKTWPQKQRHTLIFLSPVKKKCKMTIEYNKCSI